MHARLQVRFRAIFVQAQAIHPHSYLVRAAPSAVLERQGTRPMNRHFIASTFAILIAAGSIASTSGAQVARAASPIIPLNMRWETSYVLKSVLDYTAGTIVTWETILLRNTSTAGISTLNLAVLPRAFNELTSLSSLRVDGVPATGTWTNNANFAVNLGRTVAPGQSAKVTMRFVVTASSTVTTSLQGRLSKANGIMQVSHWFPIVSDGHALRYPGDAQFTLTARSIRLELTTNSTTIRIAAPGRRISESGRTHIYQIENARDFAFGASPSFRRITGYAAGVTVETYYTTGDGAAALASARSALTTFESAFGQYQWSRFVIAQTGRTGSGNEYPGIIFLGAPLFRDREVVAHETAHQWWYAMAGNDQLKAPWLDEGISEFAASYFYGSIHSYSSTKPIDSPITAFPNLPAPETSDDPGSYDQTIYFKSSAFLNSLRSRMGNTAFFSGLRKFFATNRNGIMTSREFYDTMAAYGAPTSYMDQFITFGA